MEKGLKAIVVLSAIDKMSQVFQNASRRSADSLGQLQKKQQELTGKMMGGVGLVAAGAGLAASMSPAIQAFAELEASSVALETTMMRAGGVTSKNFEEINKIAIDLGATMPGTTADFQKMMATLIRSGVEEKSIIEGVGRAAANLAVVVKIPYEEAAQLAAKLKEATGVANNEMLDFMDTIARVRQLDVSPSEMQYAFGRSAGTLKLLKLQGLEASKSVANVYAQLIKAGSSGETVGTNMSALFNSFFDAKKMEKLNDAAGKFGITMEFVDKKTGQFKGIENMIVQFDQLKKLNTEQQFSVVSAFLGPGQDAQFMNTLINNGVKGFNEINMKLQDQATLAVKAKKETETLSARYESMMGNVTNALAALGKSLDKELKAIAIYFADLAEGIQKFAEANPKLFKMVGILIGLASAILMIVGVVKIATAVWGMFNTVMLMNPWVATAAAVVAFAVLLYTYWDEIKAYFLRFWNWLKGWGKWLMLPFSPMIFVVTVIIQHWSKIVSFFKAIWNFVVAIFRLAFNLIVGILVNFTPVGLIYKNWDKIASFFKNIWNEAKKEFMDMLQWVMGFADKFFDAGAKIVQMIADGIKSKINEATKAIDNVATKVREYLPFSPAKTGPFKTLHQLKFTETMAMNIKPGPAVKAVRQVAQETVRAANSTGIGAAIAGSGGGSVNVNFSPTINMGAGGAGDKEAVLGSLKQYERELLQLIERAMERKQRTKFA